VKTKLGWPPNYYKKFAGIFKHRQQKKIPAGLKVDFFPTILNRHRRSNHFRQPRHQGCVEEPARLRLGHRRGGGGLPHEGRRALQGHQSGPLGSGVGLLRVRHQARL